MSAFFALLALMIVAHALFDYPLQGDFLAKAKNRAAPIPGVPWYQAMAAHSIIQGGAVWLITASPWLGLAEVAVHFIVDDLKCNNQISYNADQAIHVTCKVVWAAMVVGTVGL